MRPYFSYLLSFRLHQYPVPTLINLNQRQITTTFLSGQVSSNLYQVRRARLYRQKSVNTLSMFPRNGGNFDRQQNHFFHVMRNRHILVPIMYDGIHQHALLSARTINGDLQHRIPRVSNVTISFHFPIQVNVRSSNGHLFPKVFVLTMQRNLTIRTRSVSKACHLIKFFCVYITNDRYPNCRRGQRCLTHFSSDILFRLSLVL